MRRAAVRRTDFELGIKDLKEEDEHVVSRILYYANACDKFAEFELDYIIFAQKDIAEFHANEDEVMATRYVALEELDSFIEERKRLHNEDVTPWFQLLLDNKLKKWWYNYREQGQLPNEAHYIENFI